MSKEATLKSAERNDHIDNLRGLSIFLVAFLHSMSVLHLHFHIIPNWIATLVARNGYYGVTIFFVISGFLITSNSMRRFGSPGSVNPGEFYLMRFARIYPLLFVVCTSLLILDLLKVEGLTGTPDINIWLAYWTALTFQFNWFFILLPNQSLAAWQPLWSLAIEELFYILFPMACMGLKRTRFIALLLVILIVQGALSRLGYRSIYNWSGCADALALGCLAALIADRFRWARLPQWPGAALRWLGVGLIAFEYFHQSIEADFAFGPSFIALGAALCLIGTSKSSRTGLALFRPVGFLGRRSYEIYLIHMPLLQSIKPWISQNILEQHADAVLVAFFVLFAILGEVIGSGFTDRMNKAIRSTGK